MGTKNMKIPLNWYEDKVQIWFKNRVIWILEIIRPSFLIVKEV